MVAPVIRRTDYTPPQCKIDRVDLTFAIHDDHTEITAHYVIAPIKKKRGRIVLYGDAGLEFVAMSVNGANYTPRQDELENGVIPAISLDISATTEVSITARIDPAHNTALEGLYKSGGMYCTQCEPQGFRRIIWYADHPDMLSVFTTRIEAPRDLPCLLSNGNLIEAGALPGARHFAVWHDPHPKPSYLFAMVAGDLERVEDRFITAEGREVALHIYVEHGNAKYCAHAMQSLKKAMKWDEDVFGLSYDLDIFMIVAVRHFNMGAMENKGLNIFNSKFILADTSTATDDDLDRIESIIAHEYFHNWTGNRITCRDWFQLTLKEGLTVYRDQEFTADMHSRGVKRINDIAMLKAIQFPEDASPTAHPIRPQSYREINNFYTPTIYEKGAEVVRMLGVILGQDGFMKGIGAYIRLHDGKAVTTEDFIAAMESANGTDLAQFRLWYEQAGTPEVEITRQYDDKAQTLTLHFQQSLPEKPALETRHELVIPIRMGFVMGGVVAKNGAPAPIDEQIVILNSKKHSLTLPDVPKGAVPSLLRGLSAPVRLKTDLDGDELLVLLAGDSDAYGRWNAAQELMQNIILRILEVKTINQEIDKEIKKLADALHATLKAKDIDMSVKAELIKLPSQQVVESAQNPPNSIQDAIDPIAVWSARRKLAKTLAKHLWEPANAIIAPMMANLNRCDAPKRRLLAMLTHLLVASREASAYAHAARLAAHKNMTLSMAGLGALNQSDAPERMEAMAEFAARWHDNPLVLEKWFALESSCPFLSTPDFCEALMQHPQFDASNPNKLRAVIGVFANFNPRLFHADDGSGYRFLARHIIAIDQRNPQIAARMVLPLTRFARYSDDRQALMKGALIKIKTAQNLSADLSEVVEKTLN